MSPLRNEIAAKLQKKYCVALSLTEHPCPSTPRSSRRSLLTLRTIWFNWACSVVVLAGKSPLLVSHPELRTKVGLDLGLRLPKASVNCVSSPFVY